jgi:hypothetical protein
MDDVSINCNELFMNEDDASINVRTKNWRAPI